MFEVGQIFNKDGIEYCVLDLIEYNNNTYIFMSVEDGNIEYLFYEVKKINDGYNLELIIDDELNNYLFSIEEVKNNE